MSRDPRTPRTPRTLDEIIETCVADLAAGYATVEDCLARWPEFHDDLEPLLRTVTALSTLPVAEAQRDPARRASFMAELQRTPQQRPRRFPLARPTWIHALLSRMTLRTGAMPMLLRGAMVGVPAAAIGILALLVVLLANPSTASAATLTVFAGQVEQRSDGGAWLALNDGAVMPEGTTIRTGEGTHALITFPDGSTASVGSATELTLQRIAANDVRTIEIVQATGRIWNDVVPVTGEDSYTVRTPHAVVSAHGTVFETQVDGFTAVLAAEGLVRITADGQAVELRRGQSASAAAGQVTPARMAPIAGQVVIDGPFAGYLVSPDGAATGLLPNGVAFRQIAGITTTGPEATIGGQIMLFRDVADGGYSLILRRIAPGEATVTVRSAGATPTEASFTVGADADAAQVALAIAQVDSRTTVRAVDAQVRLMPVAETPAVRVVESARTRAAVDLSTLLGRPASDTAAATTPATPPAARPATATATAEATVARPDGQDTRPDSEQPTPRPGASVPDQDDRDRDSERDDQGPASPVPAVTPVIEDWGERLERALRGGNSAAVVEALSDLVTGNADLDGERMEALVELLEVPGYRGRITGLLRSGRLGTVGAAVDAALNRVEAETGGGVREQLQDPPIPALPIPSGAQPPRSSGNPDP